MLVLFVFIKDLLDILSPRSVLGKCDLAKEMELELLQWLHPTAGYLLEKRMLVSGSTIRTRVTLCSPIAGICSYFPLFPSQFSLCFLLSLHQSALFSSTNLLHLLLLSLPPSLCRPLSLCPSLTSWGTLISPSLPLPSSLLGPSCMQSRCQPGQGGQRIPHKGGDRVLGVKNTHTHTHTHTHAQS